MQVDLDPLKKTIHLDRTEGSTRNIRSSRSTNSTLREELLNFDPKNSVVAVLDEFPGPPRAGMVAQLVGLDNIIEHFEVLDHAGELIVLQLLINKVVVDDEIAENPGLLLDSFSEGRDVGIVEPVL